MKHNDCKKIKIIPLEIVLRNIAYGSYVNKQPLTGVALEKPLIDIYLKNDALNDPLVAKR